MDNVPPTHALWGSLLPIHADDEDHALTLESEQALSYIPELPPGHVMLGSAPKC